MTGLSRRVHYDTNKDVAPIRCEPFAIFHVCFYTSGSLFAGVGVRLVAFLYSRVYFLARFGC
jgi:hypothetical protein